MLDLLLSLDKALSDVLDLLLSLDKALFGVLDFTFSLDKALFGVLDFTFSLDKVLSGVLDFTFSLDKALSIVSDYTFSLETKLSIVSDYTFSLETKLSIVSDYTFSFETKLSIVSDYTFSFETKLSDATDLPSQHFTSFPSQQIYRFSVLRDFPTQQIYRLSVLRTYPTQQIYRLSVLRDFPTQQIYRLSILRAFRRNRFTVSAFYETFRRNRFAVSAFYEPFRRVGWVVFAFYEASLVPPQVSAELYAPKKSSTFGGLNQSQLFMEFLLHYVWKHHLYPSVHFTTDRGEPIEVIDVGVHNLLHAGPDFFNAKFKLAGMVWAGNVEIHLKSSDWYRHHHEQDPAYNNVVLHVVAEVDGEVRTQDGKSIPQIVVPIPPQLRANYEELIAEETYPPCYRVIPDVPELIVHQWMGRLTVERLEAKIARIHQYLEQTGGDWERSLFITLARNFGFGTNADAFEQWAMTIDPSQVGKHRDDPFQVEAFFMGQAGLLEAEAWKPEQQDDYFEKLRAEYAFLKNKFDLHPVNRKIWRFGRMRPQNCPTLRLSQLTQLYVQRSVDLSRILETTDVKALRDLFRVRATPYWQTHYAFGVEREATDKGLQSASLNLLIINSVVPLLFAYGRSRKNEVYCERAFQLLESLPAERNYITRCWERAGLRVDNAADTQALIQLRQHYCDRKDCLRCRFGSEYLRRCGAAALFCEDAEPLL